MTTELKVGQRVVDERTGQHGTVVCLGTTISRVHFDGWRRPTATFTGQLLPEVVAPLYINKQGEDDGNQ
jgi:hypothetical protein